MWKPGVSVNTTCASSVFRIARMCRRVVCGLSDTIAIFRPTSAFTSVDLPTFGRPTTATIPERNPLTASADHGFRRNASGSSSPTVHRARSPSTCSETTGTSSPANSAST